MIVVYEVLLYLVFILAAPFLLLIGIARGKYLQNLAERLGRYRHAPAAHDLWIHAVSVGESIAARPVVSEIERQRPGVSLLITTTTITGQATARRLFPKATATYFPFDFSFAVRRFLDHHRPRVFTTMETEIWPNLTRHAARRGIRMILANARISDRSFPRYRRVRALLRPVLASYDAILAREETDRERFVVIGADPSRLETIGNVKFDYQPDDRPLEIGPCLERLIDGRAVLVAGSTMEGEDEAILPELARLIRTHRCFAIVAPRRTERFDAVAGLLAAMGARFVRRSELVVKPPGSGLAGRQEQDQRIPGPGDRSTGGIDFLLLDSFGELPKLYRYAAASFVGGSLVPTGGHNPIEPAACGVPVAFGPSMSNFREIAATFVAQGAARQVRSAAELGAFFEQMLTDAAARAGYAERAAQTVRANRGASARTAERILELLG
jgi:3-deoxy-D-manno-octulosonic-acid transferase